MVGSWPVWKAPVPDLFRAHFGDFIYPVFFYFETRPALSDCRLYGVNQLWMVEGAALKKISSFFFEKKMLSKHILTYGFSYSRISNIHKKPFMKEGK